MDLDFTIFYVLESFFHHSYDFCEKPAYINFFMSGIPVLLCNSKPKTRNFIIRK